MIIPKVKNYLKNWFSVEYAFFNFYARSLFVFIVQLQGSEIYASGTYEKCLLNFLHREIQRKMRGTP